MVAAKAGHKDIVDFLLSRGANRRTYDEFRKVFAAKNGKIEQVTSLLNAGTDVNSLVVGVVICTHITDDTCAYAFGVCML